VPPGHPLAALVGPPAPAAAGQQHAQRAGTKKAGRFKKGQPQPQPQPQQAGPQAQAEDVLHSWDADKEQELPAQMQVR